MYAKDKDIRKHMKEANKFEIKFQCIILLKKILEIKNKPKKKYKNINV